MSDDFYIQEIILHKASLCPDDESLTVYKDSDCDIERIFCVKCDTAYVEGDFKQINFM